MDWGKWTVYDDRSQFLTESREPVREEKDIIGDPERQRLSPGTSYSDAPQRMNTGHRWSDDGGRGIDPRTLEWLGQLARCESTTPSLHYRSSGEYIARTTTMITYTVKERHTIPMTRERTVYVEQVEAIPNDAAVFHYDELDEDLKHRFPALIERAPTNEPVRPESVLSNGDYVKFTEYYRVTCQ
jgi:hypothetical protein